MDNNNWRAAQSQMSPGAVALGQVVGGGGGGEVSVVPNGVPPAVMDAGDWKTQLQADHRQRIVNKIMDTLRWHLPFSGQEGFQELKKIAIRFEEKIYTAATSESDYLRKISLKMLTLLQNPMANPLQPNAASTGPTPPDQVHGMQSQIQNQQLSMPAVSSQSQPHQQLLQNTQTNMTSAGVQSSAILTSAVSNAVDLTQSAVPNVIGQNPNLQNVQSMSSIAQNPVENLIGQGISSNVFSNSQRPLPGRQQQVISQQQLPQQQQPQPQLTKQHTQNTQTYLYQQLFQNHQLMKQKFQQGGMAQSLMQQQQNLSQPSQIQTSQHAVMQPSVMQSAPLSSLQQNQQSSVQQATQSVLQQQSQSVLRQQQQQQQASLVHQQQVSISQQTLMQGPQQPQQQQQMIGQQFNKTNIQHNQLIGQPNGIPDVQPQQQRLLDQQNNIPNLQQQQLMGQQNSLSNMHQPQMGPQGNVSGLHQQSMLGTQSGNSGMPTNQHSLHMLQQSKVPVQQQMQQNAMALLPGQNQLSQQAAQQQMVSHIQSQSVSLQQVQQRLPTSGSLLQQQKHLFQSQRVNPEASSNSLDSTAQTGNVNGGDWREEVYQKIKSMKDMYYLDLNDMLMKIATKLQQHDSLPQQPRNEPLEKLRSFKIMLERLLVFLRSDKSDIQIIHKDKLAVVEKQIINILNSNRPRRSVPLQQGQPPHPKMPSVQHSQTQSQIGQMPLSDSLDSTAQTGNVNGGDWQEEVYQKIKSMKDMYYLDLNDMLMKIATKLQQHDSLPQQPRNEPLEKLRYFKIMLERLVVFLRSDKSDIQITHKDKLAAVEKQIINILNSNRPRRSVPLQQGQPPHPQMPSVQHSQTQSQIGQMPPHDNQMNSQMQPINIQSSMTTMQPNNLTNLQHNSLSSIPPVSSSQQNMMSSLQPATTLDMGQNNALNPQQQVAVTSIQANPIGGPQMMNVNSLSSHSGISALQSNLNNSLQTNSNLIPNQHIKQEQQTLPTQQLKQQMHQQKMQMLARQQLMQQQQPQQLQPPQSQQHQQQQQVKQQHPSQLSGHQMSPLHQMTDSGDLKVRQMGVKATVFQHHSNGQRTPYHNQLKSGTFPVSPPQVLQAHSPQVPPLPSPQIDQQNILTSMAKAGTPLQSANSSFVAPSPSTPLAPSPMPGESEKLNSSISSLSNTGNLGPSQVATVTAAAQSLAIGTPGISASPLLAEFSSLDGAHVNASTAVSCKSNVVEQPLERLIKAVKSVVSMVDRIAGSAPGNGSRAAVGEDLVAMTKCRLQARNFFTQDGPAGTKRMRRSTSAMPSNCISSVSSVHDSVRQLNGSDALELESTATSSIRRPRIEANHALVEEIREINRRLIETVLEISDDDVDPTAVAAVAEGGEGIIVKCSFSAVALSPNLKSQYASAQMSPIQPLRLLIPTNYPHTSPILLDKFPVAASKEYEHLSLKAKSKFNISLRTLSQPMCLWEMARTWDVCARAVVSEFAQQSGGGTFSSKYGTWESCLTTV